jgi:hypothetical protein
MRGQLVIDKLNSGEIKEKFGLSIKNPDLYIPIAPLNVFHTGLDK